MKSLVLTNVIGLGLFGAVLTFSGDLSSQSIVPVKSFPIYVTVPSITKTNEDAATIPFISEKSSDKTTGYAVEEPYSWEYFKKFKDTRIIDDEIKKESIRSVFGDLDSITVDDGKWKDDDAWKIMVSLYERHLIDARMEDILNVYEAVLQPKFKLGGKDVLQFDLIIGQVEEVNELLKDDKITYIIEAFSPYEIYFHLMKSDDPKYKNEFLSSVLTLLFSLLLLKRFTSRITSGITAEQDKKISGINTIISGYYSRLQSVMNSIEIKNNL